MLRFHSNCIRLSVLLAQLLLLIFLQVGEVDGGPVVKDRCHAHLSVILVVILVFILGLPVRAWKKAGRGELLDGSLLLWWLVGWGNLVQ